MVLVAGLSFRARQRFAACTVDGLKGEKVLRANPGNRAFEYRRACGALADFASDPWSQSRIVWLTHHSQYVPDAVVRNQLQEGRLLELHRQALPERVVENGIAGHVREIGDHNRVFLSQSNGWTLMKKQTCAE